MIWLYNLCNVHNILIMIMIIIMIMIMIIIIIIMIIKGKTHYS